MNLASTPIEIPLKLLMILTPCICLTYLGESPPKDAQTSLEAVKVGKKALSSGARGSVGMLSDEENLTTRTLSKSVSDSHQPYIRESISEEPVKIDAASPLIGQRKVRTSHQSKAAQQALLWMERQLGPARPTEAGKAARLIDSYEDEVRAGWTYDSALAVIVFTEAGQTHLAREVLFGLRSLQGADGSWPFSYHPDRGTPTGENRYSGAMAWIILSVNYYEEETGDTTFATMAKRGLDYLLRFRENNPSAPHHGAISMGPTNPQAFSVENNLAAYSALLWRGELDQDRPKIELANDISRFILQNQWSDTALGADQGYFKVGYRDNDFYLDAQSWTVLTFWHLRQYRQRLGAALDSAIKRLETVGSLNDIRAIIGFNEAVDTSISQKVWGEGSEGMVAALRMMGRTQEASLYHDQTKRYQSPSGGIPYATENGDNWPTSPSVASTAWFLINELKINPFHPAKPR